MKFEWINKQGVSSDAGFVLQGMHRFYYHYVEDGRVMMIKIEPGLRGETILRTSFDSWLPPHVMDEVSSDEKERIRYNVSSALDFMKIKHTFEK